MWRVESPNVGPGTNYLKGLAAVSSTDVWAAGFYRDVATGNQQTLAVHWDGGSWVVVPSPSVGVGHNTLHGISARSSDDVWAVGSYKDAPSRTRTLVEHWNGSSCTVVPSPNVGSHSNVLKGVTAVAADDVWVVGHYRDDAGNDLTLVEHWDGSSWTVVPSPNVGPGAHELGEVTAAAPNDVWAAGYYTATGAPTRTLLEHWDGARWKIVASPNVGTTSNQLKSISAASSTSVWAVGQFRDRATRSPKTLVERWNGSVWKIVSSPNVGTGSNILKAVAAVSPKNVWAVGYRFDTATGHERTLVERWTGGSWQVVPSANAGTGGSLLKAVAPLPGTREVWARAYYYDAGSSDTEH